ncbi:MAG: hypothetical protein ACOYXB_05970 [Bacteroidota bacterium]
MKKQGGSFYYRGWFYNYSNTRQTYSIWGNSFGEGPVGYAVGASSGSSNAEHAWGFNYLTGQYENKLTGETFDPQTNDFSDFFSDMSAYYSFEVWKFNGAYFFYNKGEEEYIYLDGTLTRFTSVASGGGGWYDNAGVYVTGAVLTAEDIYNNYLHNHTTYFLKNGTERTILNESGVVRNSNLAKNAANVSTTIKVLGTAGTVLMTAQAGTKIYNGNATGWDYGDFTVGTAGSLAGIAEIGGYAVPGVGEAVAAYSWFRLWFDLGAKYGPSKWYGDDDTRWFK